MILSVTLNEKSSESFALLPLRVNLSKTSAVPFLIFSRSVIRIKLSSKSRKIISVWAGLIEIKLVSWSKMNI